MTTPLRRRPVPRANVAIATVGLVLLFASVIAAGETLRHPYETPSGVSEADLAGSDPRDELQCPDPQPREGQERAQPDQPRAAPVEVSSNELFDCPTTFDGREVIYRGEVVGALLRRDEGVWTQLNDDVYAELLGPLPAHRDYRGGNAGVGVLLPYETAERVSYVGGPQTRGDIMEVRGIFERVDRGGEVAVIHATTGAVVGVGETYPDPPLANRQAAAWIALAIAATLVIVERIVASRR